MSGMNKIILGIAAALLIIGAGFLAYTRATEHRAAHSTGAFSFIYPEGMTAKEEEYLLHIYAASSTRPIAEAAVLYYPGFIETVSKAGGESEEVTVSGLSGVKRNGTINSMPVVYYALPLDGEANSKFFFLSMYPGEDKFSEEQMTELVKSVRINKAKALALGETMKTFLETKKNSAQLSQALGSLVPIVEAVKQLSKSYEGICKADPKIQNSGVVDQFFVQLKQFTGDVETACFATKDAYAVAAKLPSGSYGCIANGAQYTEVKKLITGPSCEQ
jgi:hypothetical protein